MNQLGKYQLVAEIARGGMGIVYLAVAHGPARFSKLLVVKELKPELVEDTSFLEMFLEEARLSARLNHPHIVQTYEIGSEGNRHFMVMDYLEGVTLSRIQKKRSPQFTLAMQLRVLADVLSGLHYAHTLTDFDGSPLGIVHRDATPQNVFLTYDGQVKLVDFGIAKALDSGFETRTGTMKGKPAYMSPEQIQGTIDPRADVFSVGVMLWEAIAGKRMFSRKSDIEILATMLQGEMPSLRAAAPDVDDELARITQKALERNIEARYATAADFRNDVEAYLLELGPHQAARDIGTVVESLFADERKAVRATVESYLAAIKAGKPQQRLPSIRPHALDPVLTPSGASGGGEPRASMNGGADALPMNGSVPAIPPPSSVASFGSIRTGMTETKLGATIPIDVPVSVGSMAPPPATMGRNIAIAVAGIAIAIAAFAVRKKDEASGSANAAANAPPAATVLAANNPAPPSPASAPPPVPTTRVLHVRATPETATISIDGTDGGSTVDHTCIAGESVFVRAAAPGFSPYERQLTCDTNADIELALAPVATSSWRGGGRKSGATITPTSEAQPPAPAAPTAAAASPAPTTAASPPGISAGGTRPNRPIETASPYGN